MSQPVQLPRWIDIGLLPLWNLCVALAVAGLVVLAIGQSPSQALSVLLQGSLGSARGLGYTLYYTTTFIFTGLAVAVAFHGGLFNIGGEGQAMLGGVGVALLALWLSPFLPAGLMLPLVVLAAALGGMLWAAVPAYLQAWRGSHIVITTIMFNFLASSLNVYLLVNWLRPKGSMAVESAAFADSARMPALHTLAQSLGLELPSSPLNLSLLLALLACVGVWWFLWKSRAGYALRAVGSAPRAAHYAGIKPRMQVLLAMGLSGALAGMVAVNEISGVQGKLTLDFVAGAGFTGIAVSLMGRNHPVGIVLAALLFGALYQGGVEVAFEIPGFSREMVVTVQGLIVLFAGAMATVSAPLFARLYKALARKEG
ncbi:MAG: ABC transporter permease [Roseateles asaccharophilus]|jgi:simple sugar transport system permease protein|uniref:Nucleoside ABC transporter membrane protein n=1 Tax=Roseateles asaccharophilus TaxID=582607 RepID=A0A4R6N9V9_9BURK|nr:ABC transporter permease [Roseateles asaccharophilus]MDN3543457.1 ABC transporter permease [Roseateles asaccharophilus]TDP12165.1 nucleoside ABC transporter membrane protein [Roseateles asaccharophilus]